MGVEYFYDQQGYGQEDCLVTPSELETEEVTVAEEEEDDYMNSVELEDPTVFRLEESELPSALTSSNRATSRSPVSVSHLPSSTTEAIASTAPALPVQSFPVSSLTTAALSSKSCDVPSRSSAPSTTTIKPIACKPILPMQLTPFTTSTTPAIMPGAVKPHPVLSAGPVPHSAVPVLLLPMQNPETPGSRLTHRLLLPATPGPLQVLSVPHTSQHYRKRKLDKARAGIHVRSHVRRSSVSVCKQCQKDRKASTHVQYYGNWYCEETATVKLSEWRKRLAAKGYGKRKGTR